MCSLRNTVNSNWCIANHVFIGCPNYGKKCFINDVSDPKRSTFLYNNNRWNCITSITYIHVNYTKQTGIRNWYIIQGRVSEEEYSSIVFFFPIFFHIRQLNPGLQSFAWKYFNVIYLLIFKALIPVAPLSKSHTPWDNHFSSQVTQLICRFVWFNSYINDDLRIPNYCIVENTYVEIDVLYDNFVTYILPPILICETWWGICAVTLPLPNDIWIWYDWIVIWLIDILIYWSGIFLG